MDQMIQQIIEYSQKYKVYSDDEIKKIAEYLTGKNTFEKIIQILAQPKEKYYPNMYIHIREIADGVEKDLTLLPRLGRHLKLIEYMNDDMYRRMAFDLISPNLSFDDIFIKGKLGEEALLAVAVRENHYNNYKIKLKDVLETVYERNPEAIIKYLNQKDLKTYQRFTVSAFLFGRTKQSVFAKILNLKNISTIKEQFDSDIAASILVNLRSLPRGSLEKYLDKLDGENKPNATNGTNTANGTERKFFEKVRKIQNINSFATDKIEDISNTLFQAFIFSDFKIETFNKRMALLCSINHTMFLNRFSGILSLSAASASYINTGNNFMLENYLAEIDEQNQANNTNDNRIDKIGSIWENAEKNTLAVSRLLTDIFRDIGVDFPYLFAWAAEKFIYRPSIWRSALDNYYFKEFGEYFDKTREIAKPHVKIYLDYLKGAEIKAETITETEKILIDMLEKYIQTNFGDQHDEAVINWLKGELPEEDFAKVPPLGGVFGRQNNYYSVMPPHYDFDMAIVLLHDKSEIYGRYLKYISVGGHIHRVKLQINLLSNLFKYTQEKIIDIIEKHVDVVETVVKIAESTADYYNNTKKFDKTFMEVMLQKDPSVAVKAMERANADGRLYLFDLLYEKCPDYDPDFLISCLGDKSKKVSQHAFAFLYPKKELIEKIRPLLDSKKKALREAAEKLMAAYENPSNSDGGGETSSEADLISYCTRTFPKSGMRSISWAISGDLPVVRLKNSDSPANEIIIQCYLYQYLTSGTIEIPHSANNIRAILNGDDLRKISEQIFAQWLNDGAPAKRKSAALFFAVHADDANVLALKKQIDDWADNSRGAIAAEAIKAMALGGSDLALMTVDSVSRKFKNKQVMNAAREAFSLAAKSLGVSAESLGDRIIPTLGFDERGEKYIDYGTRKFKAVISADLNMNITLEDESGKPIKSLPKPGAKDNSELAEKSKKEFSALKKTLKTVTSTQIARLESVLSSCRKWTCESWENLFIKNPVMHSFSTGLIWGVYDGNNKLINTFRYMEDGSFNTIDEDIFDFDAVKNNNQAISLPHPLDMAELDPELSGKWKQQLEDYNITQPLVQLERPIYKLDESEMKQTVLLRFGGKKMLGITLLNKLQKSNWNRGSVQDGGGFSTMFKEDDDTKIGVQIYFDYMYVSPDPTEVITIGEVAFYKAGEIARGSYVYDDVTLKTVIPLAKIPERVLSETIYELTSATESSQETDENWRKNNTLVYDLKSKKK